MYCGSDDHDCGPHQYDRVDPTHFVGVLAVFAAAAFYLLPSANKMSEYLASIIHNGVVIHKIGEEYTKIRDLEIDLSEERDYPAMALEREIRVNDMTFTYPGDG